MTLTCTLAPAAPEGTPVVVGIGADALAGHAHEAHFRAVDFTGAPGTRTTVTTDGVVVRYVGLGGADRTLDAIRRAGAAAARAGAKLDAVAIESVADAAVADASPSEVAQALAEGVVLGGYRFVSWKSDPDDAPLDTIVVVGTGGKRIQQALDLGIAIGSGVAVARDLVNEPGGSLTPQVFADRIVELAKRFGFSATVLDEAAIAKAEMGGVLGVNRGSELPPRFVELSWAPSSATRSTLALVGKGITFDSGGLSLKPSDSMMGMKGDMAGAAAVVGAFCALRAVNPRVAVKGYLPLTDNMTGGDATRLGDVLRYPNGKTVEIHNTDAEGRLVLADALIRACADEATAIVDLATLTGACMVALGQDHCGVFGNDDGWIAQVQSAADRAGEKHWHLPMPAEWRKLLDSDIADLRNIGGRYGGASTAALFLSEFVADGTPWVHLDIAGPAFADSADVLSRKGGTGFGVRTLLALAKGFKKP